MNHRPSILRTSSPRGSLRLCVEWLLLFGLLVTPARAEVPATQPAIDSTIETLVKQLSDEQWSRRQRAQGELVKLGPDALAALEKIRRNLTDEEARMRVDAAMRQIDENRANGASQITLKMAGAHPREIFAEIARQSSTAFKTQPPTLWESKDWPTMNVELDHEPFWNAMRIVCTRAGVTPANSGLDREMVITDASGGYNMFGKAPYSVHGPFLIMATFINRNTMIDLSQPQNVRRSCNLQLMVYPEPKIRVLQGSYMARLDEAVDENGLSMAGPTTQFGAMMQPSGTWAWNLNVSLTPQSSTSNVLARLKGAGRFVVQSRSETVDIKNVMQARTTGRTAGGKRFVMKLVSPEPANQYMLYLTLFRSQWSPNDWSFNYPFSTFKLFDAEGNPLPRISAGPVGGAGEMAEVALRFQGREGKPPARLTWEVPTETREVAVPFDFENVVLP